MHNSEIKKQGRIYSNTANTANTTSTLPKETYRITQDVHVCISIFCIKIRPTINTIGTVETVQQVPKAVYGSDFR